MTALHSWLLGLAALLGTDPAPPPAAAEVTRLREMLLDRQHPSSQSQAALLLVQARWPEAETIVRKGLKQTDAAEVFLALAEALRLCRDDRFTEELLAALAAGRPPVRQAAAETLAVLADANVLLRLQGLIEDPQADVGARQAALATLGRCGRKAAVVVLLEQLASPDEPIRRAAADALADLSGEDHGADVAAWRSWWQSHKELPNERWLEERLAYQTSRARRLEGDLDRAKTQLAQLHQQYYARLPAADRINHVQTLADHEDPSVRALAVSWSSELLPGVDVVGQRTLADLLLRLCHDGNASVQLSAALALGRVNDPRAVDQLRRLLRHGSAPVRAAAAHALAQQALASASKTGIEPVSLDPQKNEMMRQVVPLLQKALDDPALEVVVAAAEDLGTLGVPEAGPVLTALLRHPSEPVRQTAAQALEHVADAKIIDGLLAALDDPAVTVRFGLVGALGRAAGDGQPLSEPQRTRLVGRLEELVLRDSDSGVRSRAARVLGQCAPSSELSFLWRRVLSREDSRVQETAWAAMVEILVRSGNLDLLHQWDRTLSEANQGTRRLQMLLEVCERWRRSEATRPLVVSATEALVQAQLEQRKWDRAFPLVRDLLTRPGSDSEVYHRLTLLLTIGECALSDGNRGEAMRAVREAQPYLTSNNSLAGEFDKLEKRARP
jgi:HEAT repeat protein